MFYFGVKIFCCCSCCLSRTSLLENWRPGTFCNAFLPKIWVLQNPLQCIIQSSPRYSTHGIYQNKWWTIPMLNRKELEMQRSELLWSLGTHTLFWNQHIYCVKQLLHTAMTWQSKKNSLDWQRDGQNWLLNSFVHACAGLLMSRGYPTSNLSVLRVKTPKWYMERAHKKGRQYLTAMHIERMEETMICLEGICNQN